MSTFKISGPDSAGNPVTIEGSITGSTPVPPPVTNRVTMAGDHFNPPVLTVPVGTSVTFLNDDNQPHWIRGDFDLGDQPAGVSRSRNFSTPGTWNYMDAYHGAKGQIVVTGAVPAPEPVPLLSTLTVQPAQVIAGAAALVAATLTAPAVQDVVLSLIVTGAIDVPASLRIPAGQTQGSTPITTRSGQAATISIAATFGGVLRSTTLAVVLPTPGPTPGNRINARDMGAKGDGTTDDTAAIQRALTAATSGKEVFLPAGSYLLSSGLAGQQSGVSLLGEGDASRLLIGMRQGIHVGGAGVPVQDFAIRQLCFYGAPGKFNADGNGVAHAVLCDGAKNVVVEDVLFVAPGHAVYQANQAVGLTVRRCRVTGYGRVCFGLGDFATVEDTRVVQNYPDPANRGLDYIFYLHNASHNVMVRNCQGSGAGGYAIHGWAQAVVGPAGPWTIQDCAFSDCAIGMIIANSPASAGRVQGLTVQHNTWTGPVRGSCIVIRQGDGVLFAGNTIKSSKQAVEMLDTQAIAVGQWGPNDPGGSLTNAVFRDNVIDGWDQSLLALASNGGVFQNCQVGPGNVVSNCRNPIRAAGIAGLTSV